jgi:hypothetical protein
MPVILCLKEISNTWIRNDSATIFFIVAVFVIINDLLNVKELSRNKFGIYQLVQIYQFLNSK